MPNASAANAPCVLVCDRRDDGHAGQRRALLGADDVDDALPAVEERKYALAPCSRRLLSSVSTCMREIGS